MVARAILIAFGGVVAAAFFIMSSHIAYAGTDCSDQKGKVIFEDTFADDAGAWPQSNNPHIVITFGKPALAFKLEEPVRAAELLNLAFDAKDADYCLELVAPQSIAADNGAESGIRILDEPQAGYSIVANQSGNVVFRRWANKSWQILFASQDPLFKSGAVVTLRALLRDGLIRVMVNGTEVKKLRIPVPEGNAKFGIAVATTKPVPAPGVTFQFNKLRVTTGQ